jgi:hypothetical protein
MGATGVVVGLLTGGLELALPPQAKAQSTLTPDAALAELMAGNERFVTRRITSDAQDLAIHWCPGCPNTDVYGRSKTRRMESLVGSQC